MTTVVTGPGIRVYQALAIRKGLEFYLRTGMRLNTAYTPKAMLATAAAITGKTYLNAGRVNQRQAANDLTEWIDAQHAQVNHD